jgi:hypothetical protein
VSQTPQLHFNGRSASLKEALVTAGDIEGIPGGPLNVTVSKVNDATGLYQDPDPRLPCGAKAPKLNARNAVEEQFAMPEVNGYEVAANLPESQIRRLFNSYEGDVRPGCSYQQDEHRSNSDHYRHQEDPHAYIGHASDRPRGGHYEWWSDPRSL